VPEIPEGLEYLLQWYYELAARRAITMAGVQAITYAEILAWARLTYTDPQPLEVDILCRLDDIYRGVSAERVRDETKRRSSKAKAKGA